MGDSSRSTTEWISLDGSPPMPGPFQIRHGQQHCTIQVSPDVIVITGGASNTYNYVTEYQLTGDGMERQLEGLNQGRRIHACGVYQAAGSQMLLVTGGFGATGDEGYLSSTEISVYGTGLGLSWSTVEGGHLPESRGAMRGVV